MIPLEAPPGAWLVPPWEVVGGILAGVAALVTAIAGGAKIVGELREVRRQTDRAAADAAAVLAQQHPDHGSSMRDALNRVEALTQQNATELAALRDDVADMRTAIRRHDRELGRANDLAAGAAARATQAERRYDEQLSDHSIRLHHLEAASRKENSS
nr:MAG TPA: Protein of unknown function (DUF2746) [Caudoviricetes sp.]